MKVHLRYGATAAHSIEGKVCQHGHNHWIEDAKGNLRCYTCNIEKQDARNKKAAALRRGETPSEESDSETNHTVTARRGVSVQRTGQARLRAKMLRRSKRWGGGAYVDAFGRPTPPEMLVTAHMKPFSKSTPEEAGDLGNVLPLRAEWALASDKQLVAFTDHGCAVVHPRIAHILSPAKLVIPEAELPQYHPYFEYTRRNFKKDAA